MRAWKQVLGAVAVAGVAALLPFGGLRAADTPGSFFIQVTPSPLVATVKPGQQTELELQIRNAGTAPETLKIASRSFKYNSADGDVTLDDQTEPEVAAWISYSAPTFTVQAGQLFTEKVRINVPSSAGFSYSFAFLVSRVEQIQPQGGSTALQGAVAVFSLINIDKPGASRKLEVTKFSAKRGWYEYLPADLDVQLKNAGNTIVLPAGNVFIQRGAKDKTPISIMPVNGVKGYVLPDTTRTFTASWQEGFPAYKTVDDGNGGQKRQLTWNWADLGKLRIGRYTAKLVAVYNDGVRDVPIEAEISFWIIPWKILLGGLAVGSLILAGLFSLIRPLFRRRK